MVNVELNFTDAESTAILKSAGYEIKTYTFIDYQSSYRGQILEIPIKLNIAYLPSEEPTKDQLENESYSWFKQRYGIPIKLQKVLIESLIKLVAKTN